MGVREISEIYTWDVSLSFLPVHQQKVRELDNSRANSLLLEIAPGGFAGNG